MTSFEDIKAKCLRDGVLYEDPDFEAKDHNVYYSRDPPRPIEWKRPKELVANPKFTVGGASRLDIIQGGIRDSWFMAALSSLAMYESLLNKVVPGDQGFGSDYAGVFHFKFWRFGKWVDIVIDDRLPTMHNKLFLGQLAANDDFWVALLEKAYAKLHGSYEALTDGQVSEGMEDMTGGISETYQLGYKAPQHVTIQRWLQRKTLIGCSIAAKKNEIETKTAKGLVTGLHYSITGARKVHAKRGSETIEVHLVRIRNPWGIGREWGGAWSDRSGEWSLVSEKEKRQLGLTFEEDGEFWMTYDDLIKNFTTLEACSLSPENISGSKIEKEINGSWQKNVSAGGCRNFLSTFATNPQFMIDLDDAGSGDKVAMFVQLMQKDRRKQKSAGLKNLNIGFAIYKMPSHDKSTRLDRDFFAYHNSAGRSTFAKSRSVVRRFSLPAGSYCIVPSTFDPQLEGEFLLRIFIERKGQTREEAEIAVEKVRDVGMSPAESKTLDGKFKSFFDKLAGRDEEIDAHELQQIMEAAFKAIMEGKSISQEACKIIIASMDKDKSGKLNFEEFKEIWVLLKKRLKIFTARDKDNSGTLNAYELPAALKDIGIQASNDLVDLFISRYGNAVGGIRFDDFLTCVFRFDMLHALFQKYQISDKGKACFGLDEFLLGTLAC